MTAVLLISAPRLGVYYFFVVDSVCLCVCPSVCLFVKDKLQIDSSLLILDGIEPFLGLQLSMLDVALYKTLFLDFRFSPPNAQNLNLLPKIACDNATLPRRYPWSRTRQFSSCLEKVGNPLNFGAWPLLPWQRNLAQAQRSRRLYRLVCYTVCVDISE